MNAAARLGLYGAGLAGVFAVAFGGAALLAPASAADDAKAHGHSDGAHGGAAHAPGSPAHSAAGGVLKGVASVEQGYTLADLDAPAAVGEAGTLSFRLTDPDGAAVAKYDVEHEKELHLIVVRTDGAEFRHVHPTRDANGAWSIPWSWNAAGGYRVYADFTPTALREGLTLTRPFQVAGDVSPQTLPATTSTAPAGPYQVTLTGGLIAGDASSVDFTVTRDGEPARLEPYLGAQGHLVALRETDLAFLHVHPEHADTEPQDASEVSFAAHVPTAGGYLLYLDFQVDGQVFTAAFRVEAS